MFAEEDAKRNARELLKQADMEEKYQRWSKGVTQAKEVSLRNG